jgi:hypothetical protein
MRNLVLITPRSLSAPAAAIAAAWRNGSHARTMLIWREGYRSAALDALKTTIRGTRTSQCSR